MRIVFVVTAIAYSFLAGVILGRWYPTRTAIMAWEQAQPLRQQRLWDGHQWQYLDCRNPLEVGG